MDVDAVELHAKPDDMADLRTLISRPSSVSDADDQTDDYNVKPNKMMKK